jgi:putative CocE/NonD family hydrolase
MRRLRWTMPIAAAAGCFFLLWGRSPEKGFERREVLITMRDGVRLHTEINTPKDAREPLPILMVRTPYDAASMSADLAGGAFKELADDGYIFVFQDIRGRYQSGGRFVMMRPPRESRGPKSFDESTDAYDTIEWLIHHVPRNNGRVGVFGISYPAWLAVMAAIEPHPALKAISEQASPADMFLGDDFYHNGAFRLSYGFEYATRMETSNVNVWFRFDRHDTFEWYLNLVPLSSAEGKYLQGVIPTWRAFEQHLNYDEFWQRRAVASYLGSPKAPNLNVAGWWDQEDFYGPQKIYETLERNDSGHLNYFVAGPWNHGGWASGEGRSLGDVDFESSTAEHFRERIEAPWFAYWLKGEGSGSFPEARVFETGANRWETYESWPPRKDVEERRLYLNAGQGLSFEAPREAEGFDTYVSDPARPVPYRPRPIGPTYGAPGWSTWLVQDQRFVHLRPDVLSWESAPLTSGIHVAGDIVAHLFASTSGSDSDWVVKLIDVYPEDEAGDRKLRGFQLMIASEIFRARFRRSFERGEAVKPGAVEEYTIDLHTNDHEFQAGHRIMVQVQSTWFPLYSRNPQQFVPSIFTAEPAAYQAATQRVYRSREHPSNVRLPVLQ